MCKLQKTLASLVVIMVMTIIFSSANAASLDYSSHDNWAYYGSSSSFSGDVDVFFVCPTVFLGSNSQFNMDINDPEIRKKFVGAINMEKGIYDTQGVFYAPYYRQAAFSAYKLDQDKAEPYFELSYQDVKAAFKYYLKEQKQNRPIVLAGFSQGADMILRLMKDMYHDQNLQKQLVAAYVIGWRVTPEEIIQYPYLKMAQGERDTGVIISFNSEDPEVKTSPFVPQRTLGINPLNWTTTSQLASKSLNIGAAFTNYDGLISKEIPHLTGAFLDKSRGTLKLTDIAAEDYPPILDLYEKGIYHIYDYQFFYRNLQQNVNVRIEAYKAKHNIRKVS